MLSDSFDLYMGNQQRMNNFLRGLAQVVLCLARLPQPRIGSYIFNNDGTIILANRPLTVTIALLERDGASRAIDEHTTYTSVEPYVTDVLTYHDNRFREQPNAVNNEYDGVNQMTTSVLMRALAHQYLLPLHPSRRIAEADTRLARSGVYPDVKPLDNETSQSRRQSSHNCWDACRDLPMQTCLVKPTRPSQRLTRCVKRHSLSFPPRYSDEW